jgi:D-serine dehydratase
MDENSTLTKEDYNIKNEEYINVENELKNTLNELENMNQLVEKKKNKLKKFYFIIKKKVEFTDFNKDLIEEFLEKIVVNENKLLKIFLINDKYEVDLSSKYDEKIILNHHERQVSLPNRINLYNIMSYNGNNYDIEIYLYA